MSEATMGWHGSAPDDPAVMSLRKHLEDNNGITLIPEKNMTFTLGPEDSLVVLAEDEL